jgi:uncharacterized phage-associated protein/DNA-binding transcriptional regulator YiaG
MNSPITGEPMRLVKESITLMFRKEEISIISHYYLCEASNERYNTDELEELNQTQIHNQYREKYGIPFSDEIKEIREQYNVSASKMSEILGLGTNSWRLYENGEVPSVANGRLILAVKNPQDFIRQIEASEHILRVDEKIQLLKDIEALDQKLKKQADLKNTASLAVANEFSGFRKLDLKKIAQVIGFFSSKKVQLYQTKLNKLLFYADFLHYRQAGYSITGIRYRAIQFGPVPITYESLYLHLESLGEIVIEKELYANNEGMIIQGKTVEFDFSQTEQRVLECVLEKFGNLLTRKVVDLSHDEPAWIQNQATHNIISYQKYAFSLKNV